MPTPVIWLQIEALARGVTEEGLRLCDQLAELPRDLWDAFPNPLAMYEAVASFSNRFLATAIALPFTGLESKLDGFLTKSKLRSRAMTSRNAVRWSFEGFRALAQTITFTRDFGFTAWLAQSIAVWLYRTFKHWNFVWQAMRIKSDAELAQLFVRKFANRIGTLRIAGLIIGGFLVLAWAGAQLLMVGMAITLADGSAEKLMLPQDSRRERSTETYAKRINLRVGRE